MDGLISLVACEQEFEYNDYLQIPKDSLELSNKTVQFKQENINTARLSSCGKYVITGSWEGVIRLTDIYNNNVTELFAFDDCIKKVGINTITNTVVALSDKILYTINCNGFIRFLKKHKTSIFALLIYAYKNSKKFSESHTLRKLFLNSWIFNKHKFLELIKVKPEDMNIEICSICNSELSNLQLKCNHTLCDMCFSQIFTSESKKCPFCRKTLELIE